MNYRIEKKEEFTVIANAKTFAYENAKEIIPQFWHEHYASDKSQAVCGEFGINIDEMMGMDTFEYLIADEYEFAAGYCIEMYDDPQKYAKGTMDENYYCEIWIPVKRK